MEERTGSPQESEAVEPVPAAEPPARGEVVTASAPAAHPPPAGKSSCGCGGGCGQAVSPADGAAGHGSAPYPPYVYAVGRIEPRLPSLGVEKEFAQATGRAETTNMTDRQALHAVLSEPQNRYLAKQLCFVLMIQGIETYIVRPRDPVDYSLLVEALGAAPRASDLHVVIGLRGPFAPPDLCNGLMLPVVAFDQIYAFDAESLIAGLPKPDAIDDDAFRSASRELFESVMQIADNAGASDEHRALNYVAVRYAAIYAKTADSFVSGLSLTGIETRPSRLSGSRNIQDVLFSYTNRTTDVTEKYFVRVDVTEEFPFLVTKLSPYYDR
ncbi:hypothetical protein M5362_21070 [Streptomyces sp. Je 1-79]|uniref:cyanobactin maturation protease PatG family protein n=1 Tax=Streptomyces sp. Je 1-79 TaxID=2943847 RepID=UPI0021A51E97|nr:hypothetical protein [Streptomyces sp. Je 1-79]MCT4355632.1 hypothetical protein [Streptomyces sp. Je 1-79]